MIKGFFKRIYNRIVNLIKWFPIIYNDRNWDQCFFYKIMKFKLEQMEKFQRIHGISIDSKQYAKQIKLCINLLHRIMEDDYINNALIPHEKKWGEAKFLFESCPENDSYTELNIKVEKAITEDEIKQEHKERMRLYNHCDIMKQQDLDLLFKNLKKYVEGWWD